MEPAYVAHAESCALLLDSEGVCRWVLPKDTEGGRELATAKRCIGAQFVATLDRDIEGLLGHEPAAGKVLLFASFTNGRAALLRFGPISAFDTLSATQAAAIAKEAAASANVATPAPRAVEPRAASPAPRISTLSAAPPPLPKRDSVRRPPPLPAPARRRETLPGVAPQALAGVRGIGGMSEADVMKAFYVAPLPRFQAPPVSVTPAPVIQAKGSSSFDPADSPTITSLLQEVAVLADESQSATVLDTSDLEALPSGRLPPLGEGYLTIRSLDTTVVADDPELSIETTAFSRNASGGAGSKTSRPSSGVMRIALDLSAAHGDAKAPAKPKRPVLALDFDVDETVRLPRVDLAVPVSYYRY